MLPLAIPSFVGLPTDEVKEIDAYTEVNPELKTKLASNVSAFNKDLDSLIGKSVGVVKGIGNKLLNNGMDLNEAKNRIARALGGSRNDITGLATELENSILGELTGVDPGTGYVRKVTDAIGGVKLLINGKENFLTNGNLQGLESVMGFLGDLSNNSLFKVFDLGAEAALLKGVLGEVSSWGIPELVDETFGAKWNEPDEFHSERWLSYQYDDEFRFNLAKRAAGNLNVGSDLDSIEQIILHAGANAIMAETPEFPEQLLAGYVFKEGTLPNDYPAILTKLVSIMDRLKPTWFWETRNGVPVWNLKVISGASESARTLFLTQEPYRSAILTAPYYRPEIAQNLLKQMYPGIAI